MKEFLQGQRILEHVHNGYRKLNEITIIAMTHAQKKIYDEGKQREGKYKVFILSALDDSMLPKVTGASNSKKHGTY